MTDFILKFSINISRLGNQFSFIEVMWYVALIVDNPFLLLRRPAHAPCCLCTWTGSETLPPAWSYTNDLPTT